MQPPIPRQYLDEKQEVLLAKIQAHKNVFGDRLLILGHHYQQEDVFRCADLVGDSLLLARQAAEAKEAEYIVFCGVHFMAESADILTDDSKKIILPHLEAGCPMADMATAPEVAEAWQELAEVIDVNDLTPVTYVNSSAAIKAFVGARGGSVCTSSNAEKVLTWALGKSRRAFFLPDEHLGRNSAKALGLADDEIVLWRRGQVLGGNDPVALAKAKIIVWDGYCEVHMEFAEEQIVDLRAQNPELQVIIHPESRYSVVAKADQYGSTEAIIKAVADSPSGAVWAVGTEVNLVERLIRRHPDKKIVLLAPTCCRCETMSLVSLPYLLWVLDGLAVGEIRNQISVAAGQAAEAKLSLERMLQI